MSNEAGVFINFGDIVIFPKYSGIQHFHGDQELIVMDAEELSAVVL